MRLIYKLLSLLTYIAILFQSQLAAAAAATAVTPSSMEHNVGPMQQSSVQHLASQMNQLQMSGSQYITSPVHGSFSQASWQMMHQHGQPQHPHTHYMSLEVRNLTGCFVIDENYVSKSLKSLNDASIGSVLVYRFTRESLASCCALFGSL